MAWDVEAIRAALAQIGQPKGTTMAAPVGVDPQQAADMAAQSYGVMNNVMNRISNPSMIGRSPMFTAPSSSVLTPRSSGSIPMPTPAQPYQGTLPAGFDQGKAIEKMGLLGNVRQQQGYTIGDIIPALTSVGLYSGVGSDWGGSRNEWGGIDHERSSRGPGRGVGGR